MGATPPIHPMSFFFSAAVQFGFPTGHKFLFRRKWWGVYNSDGIGTAVNSDAVTFCSWLDAWHALLTKSIARSLLLRRRGSTRVGVFVAGED